MIALETGGIFSDDLPDTVVYNDGANSSSISAVVVLGQAGAKPGDQASILVKKSDVSDPAYRHTFTIDGAVWYVRANEKGKDFILSQDAALIELAISKNERFKQWRT